MKTTATLCVVEKGGQMGYPTISWMNVSVFVWDVVSWIEIKTTYVCVRWKWCTASKIAWFDMWYVNEIKVRQHQRNATTKMPFFWMAHRSKVDVRRNELKVCFEKGEHLGGQFNQICVHRTAVQWAEKKYWNTFHFTLINRMLDQRNNSNNDNNYGADRRRKSISSDRNEFSSN